MDGDALASLDEARIPDDMNLPDYRRHFLQGQREEFWSVWVNGNWRVTWRFIGQNVDIVNYEDYH